MEARSEVVDPSQLQTVQLTDNALNKTRNFIASKPEHQDKALRIYIQGGGCSGFSYNFMFDEKRDGDIVLHESDVSVIIDKMSLEYLKGSTVDYVEDFTKSGFEVKNPNAKTTCGCGESFSV